MGGGDFLTTAVARPESWALRRSGRPAARETDDRSGLENDHDGRHAALL
jgi:hypothetical protein